MPDVLSVPCGEGGCVAESAQMFERGVEQDVFAQYPVLPGVCRGCLLSASPTASFPNLRMFKS